MEKALILLFLLLTLYTPVFSQNPDTLLARQYLALADSLEQNRKMQEALPLLEKASTIFQESAMWEDWLISRNSLATNYRSLGDFDQATIIVEQAINTGIEKFDLHHQQVYGLKLVLTTLIFSKGDYKEAIRLCEALLVPIEEHFEEGHFLDFQLSSLLSMYYEKNKEFDKALEFGFKALGISKIKYGPSSMRTAVNYNRVGNNFIQLKDFEKATEYHQKSLAIRLEIFDDENHPRLIESYTNLGICFAEQADFEQAEDYFLKAFAIGKKTYGEVHPWTSGFLWNLGAFYHRTGDYSKTLEAYQQEFAIRTQLQDRGVDLAENHNRLGKVYRNLQQSEAAIAAQNQALALISENFSPADIYAAPTSKQVLHKALGLRFGSDKLRALYQYVRENPTDAKAIEASIIMGDLCLALWQDLRYELGQQKRAKQQHSQHTRLAVQYASLSAHSAYAQKSWELAERGKSLLLLEAYLQAEATSHARLAPEIASKEQQLSQQLADYESQLLTAIEAKDQTQIDHVRNDLIFDTRREYEQLVKEIEQSSPHYYALKYDTKTTTVADLQNLLTEEQLFVEYLVQEESNELLIFVIEKNRPLQIYRQQLPEEINDQVAEFNRLLQSYLLFRKDKKSRFVQLSHDLYQLLLQPLASHFSNKTQMIIIGESFTNYLPFEVLLPSSAVKEFTEMDFLVKRLEVVYHYSATLFVQGRQRKHSFSGDLLAFAPVFDSESTNDNPATRGAISLDTTMRSVQEDGQFSPLLHTEKEVKNIAALFQQKGKSKQRILLKKQATEEQLKAALANHYRYIHLASHSFSNLRQPELSGIACIPPSASASENGILFSGEVYNMAINSDLLVLSSCESGMGKNLIGEGLLGLNRGFVYAGIPNVVFSLWKVYDKITSEMMQVFYADILDGASYSKALRNAKLKLLEKKETASPHYWSAFLIIGN